MFLARKIADHLNNDSLAARFRKKRFQFFKELLDRISQPVRILDVGGTEHFWSQMGFSGNDCVAVTLLNLQKERTSIPGLLGMAGDARNMTLFGDREFDVVFSNSTIEHLGSMEDQQRMAAEVMRVGRRYFIQTPNRNFPIEPHFLFPFFQFLPCGLRVWIATRWSVGWYSRVGDPIAARHQVESIRLLGDKDLKLLFPDALIYRERFFGITKSFVIYGGW